MLDPPAWTTSLLFGHWPTHLLCSTDCAWAGNVPNAHSTRLDNKSIFWTQVSAVIRIVDGPQRARCSLHRSGQQVYSLDKGLRSYRILQALHWPATCPMLAPPVWTISLSFVHRPAQLPCSTDCDGPARCLCSLHPSGQQVYFLDTGLRSYRVLRIVDGPQTYPCSLHPSGQHFYPLDTGLRSYRVLRTMDRPASNSINQTLLLSLFAISDPLRPCRKAP